MAISMQLNKTAKERAYRKRYVPLSPTRFSCMLAPPFGRAPFVDQLRCAKTTIGYGYRLICRALLSQQMASRLTLNIYLVEH